MTQMTQAGVDAWNERADEIIGVGEPWPKEKAEAYNREHPAPSEDNILAFLAEYEKNFE